jgi:CSLREA domain-containing protein
VPSRAARVVTPALRAQTEILNVLGRAAVLVVSTSLAPALATLPPTFTVNSVADVADANTADGVCDTGDGHTCTLRAAIMQANQTTGATVVVPNLGSPYVLSLGEILIDASMTITGAGAAGTIVDGNLNGRIFTIPAGLTVFVSGLTLRRGRTAFTDGGAIYNGGSSLTLTRCVVEDNSAGGYGGGIFNTADLTLVESSLLSNHAAFRGGALAHSSSGATVTVDRSLVSGNSAREGGGIYMIFGSLTVTNSTFSGNGSTEDGGGISVNDVVALRVFSSTITNNQADSDFNGTGTGGGVYLFGTGTRSFVNTILADNSETFFCGPPSCNNVYLPTTGECAGTVPSLGSLILANYDTSHCTVTGSFTLTEPNLGPLNYNGGPTQTHALLAGSPAINAGTPEPAGCYDAFGGKLPVDQRGAHRPAGSACDIGAYEYRANGDVNGDGACTVADIFYLINFLFAGGAAPMGLGDVNGDTKTDVADIFYLINFLFAGGPAPV